MKTADTVCYNELIKYFDVKVEVDSKDFIRFRVNLNYWKILN
jgi:hypothetical protein